jgi:hypothetical protein
MIANDLIGTQVRVESLKGHHPPVVGHLEEIDSQNAVVLTKPGYEEIFRVDHVSIKPAEPEAPLVRKRIQ